MNTRLVILLSTTLILFSCGGGDNSNDTNSVNPSSTVSVSGSVVSYTTGLGIVGATVSSGTSTSTSDEDGNFILTGVTKSDRISVYANANGHSEQASITNVNADITGIRLALLSVDHSDSFNPTQDQNITVAGSNGGVDIMANTLVLADGSLPAGNVDVNITLIDPSIDSSVMPGDFLENTDPSTPPASIESFGAITVTFSDSNGEELNLSSGNIATVRIPVASNVTTPPTSIPLFYFDSDSGYWIEEGVAYLDTSGTFYSGEVAHFTTWNADRVYERITINGCIEDTEGNPVSGAWITSEGINYNGSASSASDASGNFSVYAKTDAKVIVSGVLAGVASNSNEVSTTTSNITMGSCLVLAETSLTVKLSWGVNPRDLDTHFVTPTGNRIYFARKGSLNSSPYIALDVDDTSSYGPEILSATRLEEEGTYTYYVHHYSGSSSITNSPARVELNQAGSVRVFTPPAGQQIGDRYWIVFSLNVDSLGSVTSINTINSWSSSRPF